MKANYWMECLMEVEIPQSSLGISLTFYASSTHDISRAEWWRVMRAALFDERFDGKVHRSRLAISFRDLAAVHIFNIAYDNEAKRFRATHSTQYPGLAIASVISTRPGI